MKELPGVEAATMLRFVSSFQKGQPCFKVQAVVALPAQAFPEGSFLHGLSTRFYSKFKRKSKAEGKGKASACDVFDSIDWDFEKTPKIKDGTFDSTHHFGRPLASKTLTAWLEEVISRQTWKRSGHSSTDKRYRWVSQKYSACFVDPGVNNLATLAFTNGLPGCVFSSSAFERKMKSFDRGIDELVADNMPTRAKALQSKRSKLADAPGPPEASG